MKQTKSVLILGRRDPTEAMRVTSGLSIFDHQLSIIFLVPVPNTPENTEMSELLEFSDIESKSTLTGTVYPHVGPDELVSAILAADEVINI